MSGFEIFPASINTYHLASTQVLDHFQCMSSVLEFGQCRRGHALLNDKFVREPLMMESGLGKGSFGIETKIDSSDDREQRLADNRGTSCRAQRKNRFFLLHYNRGAHAR